MTLERMKKEGSEEYAVITSMEDDVSGDSDISDDFDHTNSLKENKSAWLIIIGVLFVVFTVLSLIDGEHLIIGALVSFFSSLILFFLYLYLFDLKSATIPFILLKATMLATIFLVIGMIGVIFGYLGSLVGSILAIIVLKRMLGYDLVTAFIFLIVFGILNYAIQTFLVLLV